MADKEYKPITPAGTQPCNTCIWHCGIVGAIGKGKCRKKAPGEHGFPVAYDNDYCGDHKADERGHMAPPKNKNKED